MRTKKHRQLAGENWQNWFVPEFVDKVVGYIELHDKYRELDMHNVPLEVQISSSADGAAHLTGPFMHHWFYEHPDGQFEELMFGNRAKADKDWSHKIVLPEARRAFERRYKFILEQSGDLPAKFL